ncbi:hypothetical protein BO70DRAFT_368657 [Aspergillus heteromorphus CBS 117.55]|uniref:Fe2OG dioxygenase domain-containing protein n=1 Tax=Aspergillus heteromorphus CBS 117.55 TaxID=1448321 RepID=A0A317WUQ1_9EURO|nr:uncharacterized protein BO70DRAFT_368657 [Aspergillus heteromorphus CBS 117.55]PWY90076.1 hypothetical protein BO70DRAFT_368657 [Aspergillus heteromorphus CBS 117.55]
MDRFISRKRPRSPPASPLPPPPTDEDATDMKLALLMSLFPEMALETLMEILVSSGGCVETASSTITAQNTAVQAHPNKKRATPGTPAIQTSLTTHIQPPTLTLTPTTTKRTLTKKGQTLHLYSPTDIALHTPCTVIHNFLPSAQANALLVELLNESPHFSRYKFQLFDRTVQSPHSASVYVSTPEEYRQHTSEYTYGGTYRSNVRQITPLMRAIAPKVQDTVNEAIRARIRDTYPFGERLRYQSSKEWKPNAAFVNCYDGPAESVGFHSDELTYLGPQAVIGSLSLGVEREFRVRRIVPEDGEIASPSHLPSPSTPPSTPSGQISLHLPHNTLLIMHASMQEQWKHAIPPTPTISPHPVSGNRRINITYRWYRSSLHPRNTPRCRCGAHTILRCAQRTSNRENRGRYMWMCYAGFVPGRKGCGFFRWAEFDGDGEPVWGRNGNGEGEGDGDAPRLRDFVEEDGGGYETCWAWFVHAPKMDGRLAYGQT